MRASGSSLSEITPAELNERIASGDRIRFVDVREPLEHRIASVAAAELIPLSEIPVSLERLDREEEIVMMCHHGIRSARACEFLVRNGFTKILNLSGGIDRWSVDVDPTVPRY